MGDVAAMTWPLTGPGGLLPPAHRVRRCLFGRVDEETRNLDLKEHMNAMLQKNKLRWNFDFETERPMPGQYNWKLADDPADADSNGGSESQPAEDEKPVKVEQTLITDFMRKRKFPNQKDTAVKLRSKLPRKSRRRSST